jgi:hypothetical protein
VSAEPSPAQGPKRVVHPVSKHVYTQVSVGLVEVRDPDTGATATFTSDGERRSGSMRDVDLQLLGWVGRVTNGDRPSTASS